MGSIMNNSYEWYKFIEISVTDITRIAHWNGIKDLYGHKGNEIKYFTQAILPLEEKLLICLSWNINII